MRSYGRSCLRPPVGVFTKHVFVLCITSDHDIRLAALEQILFRNQAMPVRQLAVGPR